jgi:hypothetical protein
MLMVSFSPPYQEWFKKNPLWTCEKLHKTCLTKNNFCRWFHTAKYVCKIVQQVVLFDDVVRALFMK